MENYTITAIKKLAKHEGCNARVLYCSDGVIRLRSYSTIVAECRNGIVTELPWTAVNDSGAVISKSPSTTRQITYFRRMMNA